MSTKGIVLFWSIITVMVCGIVVGSIRLYNILAPALFPPDPWYIQLFDKIF
jgi:hypothetical protein